MSTQSKHNIDPPGVTRKHRMRQKAIRFFVHLFVWIGVAVLYYVAFSFFFDTPIEHRLKSSTAELQREYDALNARYDSLLLVMENVTERDKNVFRILFESDPYDLESEYETGRWENYEKLLNKSNKDLNKELSDKTQKLEKQMAELARSYQAMPDKLGSMGSSIDRIPSIQPVVNNDLTLMTASYGLRIHPFYKTLTLHPGVDYTVAEGSRVFATADGRVKDVTIKRSSSGTTIILAHDNGYETQYSHLEKVNVAKGDFVRRGDIIGLSGNTGLSLVPHLHYEVKHNGMRVDPIYYFFMELSPSDYRKLKNIARSGMQSFD